MSGQPYGYAPQVPTDGLAVASLVTSGAGLLLMAGAPGPIGIGLGIGALVRLKRNGRRGRGLAIAGIALGAVGTIVIGLLVWFFVWAAQVTSSTISQTEELLGGGSSLDQLLEDLESGSGGSSSQDLDELLGQLDEELGSSGGGSLDDLLSELGEPSDGSLDVLPSYALPQDVALGTCWVAMPEYYDLRDAEVVPCSQDHDAEVVALLTATGAPATDLTVDDPVLTAALEQCDAAVAALDPELLDWGYTDVWLPHPDQVAAGQLAGYCVYEDVLGTTDSLVAPAGTSS
ncbi:DUF4190 domain-containing protein [Cellulomonas flavigena]|uniref:DUF4190 domain-containing protein n=1 Tax=Cellulomonas flavigena TaxID=1711 RepID=UPI00030647BE|nr:DUF4190 domain-containing protein [Cellulomonas flavigena]